MNWLKLPKKVYFKRGCMPVAVRELSEVYGLKRAFIITDANLFKGGMVRPVEEWLRKGGLQIAEFFYGDGEPDIAVAKSGLPKMLEFEPDAIVGIGGGSAMNLAKAMWVLYEHPDADLSDLADRFGKTTDAGFPELGAKAKLFLISTTAGTGAECSPFALIKDDSGKKRVLASYEMLPEIAVIDSDFSKDAPRELVKEAGLTVLAQAVRAHTDPHATDYILGFARDAVKDVLDNLPAALADPPDMKARENMANAAALAGMALSNAADTLDPEAGLFPSEGEKAPAGDALAKLADLSRHIGLADSSDQEAAAALIEAAEKLQSL